MSPITTHVLDTALGRPAAGVRVALHRIGEDGVGVEIGNGETNDDGRVADLLLAGEVSPGVYRLTFGVAEYFERDGREAFYPRVEVAFRVEESDAHYHVPLLLSPFGYATYRGS